MWGGAGLPESMEKRIWRAVVTVRDPAEAPELLRTAGGGPCLWLGAGMVRGCGPARGGGRHGHGCGWQRAGVTAICLCGSGKEELGVWRPETPQPCRATLAHALIA